MDYTGFRFGCVIVLENFTQLDAEQQTLTETFGVVDMYQLTITSSNDPTNWYHNLIGEIFDCSDTENGSYRVWYKNVKRVVRYGDGQLIPAAETAQSDINTTLEERGNRYGEFDNHAAITQNLKRAMVNSPNWAKLSDDKKEALEMIAHKIGRILNGDPEYKDSWHDIIGYAKLVEKTLKD